MTTKHKLNRAIQRSERAYQDYLTHRMYFQALRIHNANKKVYELLDLYLYEANGDEVELLCDYLFHLEDWFHQFESESSKEGLTLESKFAFEKLLYSKSFPSEIKNIFL